MPSSTPSTRSHPLRHYRSSRRKCFAGPPAFSPTPITYFTPFAIPFSHNRHDHANIPFVAKNPRSSRYTAMQLSSEAADRALASAAAATAAASAAVSSRRVAAPDDSKHFVARSSDNAPTDPDGLPLSYDRLAIEAYWRRHSGALRSRWAEFLTAAVPWLTKVATTVATGGASALTARAGELARDARISMERLGPTYVKVGQMMSVRPDVLPSAATKELAALQDAVPPFDTDTAIAIVEQELGAPLDYFFSDFAQHPVAAASLAQVYRATLQSGEPVAVKVQRPGLRATVSKDLYVLRRAAQVYQQVMDRFAPRQRTNYVALLDEWAVGFYTELDFENEATNQRRLRTLLQQHGVHDVYVPRVYDELSTRKVLVSEWIDGRKISECPPEDVRELTAIGQECFLTQLLQLGFFHADPHPGNLLRLDDTSKGRLALLDFGLVATLQQDDMDRLVSALIHLANKDYASLVDDFIALNILQPDCDRAKVVPLMDRALSPYVKGGGARKYEAELKRSYGMDGTTRAAVGGFQAMTRDALTVFNDIPFSIPPYFALLARAVVTLEGIALQGDPQYALVQSTYPFVARKLLREQRPAAQQALHDVLYRAGGTLSTTRLSALVSGAMGAAVASSDSAFIDLDGAPDSTAPLPDMLRFLLGDQARALRMLLADEAVVAGDILLRQAIRKVGFASARGIQRTPLFGGLAKLTENIRGPILLPTVDGGVSPSLLSASQLLELIAPRLSREEELYALALVDGIRVTAGPSIASAISGDALPDGTFIVQAVSMFGATGRMPAVDALPAPLRAVVRRIGRSVNGRENDVSDGGTRAFDEVVRAVSGLEDGQRDVLVEEVLAVGERLRRRFLQRLSSGVE